MKKHDDNIPVRHRKKIEITSPADEPFESVAEAVEEALEPVAEVAEPVAELAEKVGDSPEPEAPRNDEAEAESEPAPEAAEAAPEAPEEEISPADAEEYGETEEEYDEDYEYDDDDDEEYDEKPGRNRVKTLIITVSVLLVIAVALVLGYNLLFKDRSQMSVVSLVDEFREKYESNTLLTDSEYLQSMGLRLVEKPFDKGNYGTPVCNDCLITEEFVAEYVSRYPATDLITFVLKAQPEIRYREAQGYGEECRIYNDILDMIERNTDVWMDYDDVIAMQGAEGYYGGMEEESITVAVRGRIPAPDGSGKMRDETRQNVRTVSYYGDWKIVTEEGYQYDPGVAATEGDDPYEVDPSWQVYSDMAVYFRDTKVTENTDFTFVPVSNSNGEIRLSYIGAGEHVCVRITTNPAFEDNAYDKSSEFRLLTVLDVR